MTAVDGSYAAWLKSPALLATTAAPGAAAWPEGARLERRSPFATPAGGQAEAGRQAAFTGGPKAQDVAIVRGRRADLLGRTITGRHDRLGYAGGRAGLVVGVAELPDDTTRLTLLVRLGGAVAPPPPPPVEPTPETVRANSTTVRANHPNLSAALLAAEQALLAWAGEA